MAQSRTNTEPFYKNVTPNMYLQRVRYHQLRGCWWVQTENCANSKDTIMTVATVSRPPTSYFWTASGAGVKPVARMEISNPSTHVRLITGCFVTNCLLLDITREPNWSALPTTTARVLFPGSPPRLPDIAEKTVFRPARINRLPACESRSRNYSTRLFCRTLLGVGQDSSPHRHRQPSKPRGQNIITP